MEQNRVKKPSEGVVKFSVVSELSIGAQISLCTGFSGFWLCPHKTRAATRDSEWDDGLGICRPVAVRGTKGRIIGDYGADQQFSEGRNGPFDILVTDDVRPWRNWLKQWWLTIHDENAMNYDHSTCVVVGDEILVFGGSNEYHEKGDLETQLAFIRENDLGGMNDMLVDHVTRAYETEEYDHAWRVTLDPDGNVYEMAYDRAGARISEQSEGAAAVVVGL
jgi:YD repeat-containing protein